MVDGFGSMAVESEENNTSNHEVPAANLQIFPPNNGGGGKGRGYQTLGGPSGEGDGPGQQPTSTWNGVFNISSYTQYFNVDTDVVLNRMISSINPVTGDFFSKIDSNPDLYGLIWISTTLIFVIAALGNCATYLMDKSSDSSTTWSFDVNYFNVAACTIYIYALAVPLAFYFLLQYYGSGASLTHFWCMWGYSLFIFIPTSCLLVIPLEFLRWIIIILVGGASGCFVALNLRSYIDGNELMVVFIAAFVLQMALALFIKVCFLEMT
ncbi:Yip1 domain [Dillenia turbinata]|uniref:Protein YIP n=1 Tax=Dillenia turbinata TaxID=194707 RepID=A0AAN8V6P7_9MAGN